MKKINKTNAARLLDKAKIAYELIPYEVDESDLSAVHVAASLGENIDCVFNPVKELLPLTGYIRGGCSPIGMKKPFPTYIHETCLQFPYIYISAGQRGLQLKLDPKDLIRETGAEVCQLF